jgi:hypothetical protein
MGDIQDKSSYSSGLHGGARAGAGRPENGSNARWYKARGINPLMAGEILARVVDERACWQRVLASQDDRIVLNALMFLVSMRDGRPAQQINVTSQSISISADSVRKAREIIAEIRGEISPRLGEGEVKPL